LEKGYIRIAIIGMKKMIDIIMCITNSPNDFIIFPLYLPEAGEPNNEAIPSKEFKYQLKSQILRGIKNERKYVLHTYNFLKAS
jgi:hypothetical protein